LFQATARANANARRLFEEAIALDPGYAHAYAGLAATHVSDAMWGWSRDPRESGRKAYEIANKAIALDDSLDIPHYILGAIYVYMREYDKAIAEGERAAELNPNGDDALAYLGYFLNVAGRPAEAITVLHKAMRLNPMPPALYYGWLGSSYRLINRNDKAIAILEKGLRVQPDHMVCLINLTAAYNLAGRQEDARKTAAEVLRLNPKFSVAALAKLYKDPAVAEQLVEALRQAGLK
jgi:adenylate cyclase